MTRYTANEIVALKDSINREYFQQLTNWMELFKDLPENFNVPAFTPKFK